MSHKIHKWIHRAVGVGVVFVASCGKSGTENYSPLSKEDKQRLLQVIESTGQTFKTFDTLALAQKQKKIKELSESTKDIHSMSSKLASCESKELSKLENLMKDESAAAIKISGKDCPIELTLNKTDTPSNKDGALQITASYKVVSEEYKKLNDVDAFTLSGKIEGQPNGQNSVKLIFSSTSKIHSQSQGDLTVINDGDVEMGMYGVNGSIKFRISGEKIKAKIELRITSSSTQIDGITIPQITSKLLLNDVELTAEDLKSMGTTMAAAAGGFGLSSDKDSKDGDLKTYTCEFCDLSKVDNKTYEEAFVFFSSMKSSPDGYLLFQDEELKKKTDSFLSSGISLDLYKKWFALFSTASTSNGSLFFTGSFALELTEEHIRDIKDADQYIRIFNCLASLKDSSGSPVSDSAFHRMEQVEALYIRNINVSVFQGTFEFLVTLKTDSGSNLNLSEVYRLAIALSVVPEFDLAKFKELQSMFASQKNFSGSSLNTIGETVRKSLDAMRVIIDWTKI